MGRRSVKIGIIGKVQRPQGRRRTYQNGLITIFVFGLIALGYILGHMEKTPDERILRKNGGSVKYNVTWGDEDYVLCVDYKKKGEKDKTINDLMSGGESRQQDIELLKAYVENMEKEQRASETFLLPDSYMEKPLKWKRQTDKSAIYILLLGLMVGGSWLIEEREQEKRKEKRRQDRLLEGYSEFVESICLLLSSGMSLRLAFRKILKERFVNEELLTELSNLCLDMENGKGTKQSLHEFAIRVDLKEYRKLCNLLNQNLMDGSKSLVQTLNNEVALSRGEAMRLFTQRAAKTGNQMLLPIMGLLAIVIIIIMMPAMAQLGGSI